MSGETVTDSTGLTARYTRMDAVKPGDVVVQGWRPFLVVESVEFDAAQTRARLRFVGGHCGGWNDVYREVPIQVVEEAPEDDPPGDAPEHDPLEVQDGEVEGMYEGFFIVVVCGLCSYDHHLENDVTNGERYECEGCGKTMVVTGR